MANKKDLINRLDHIKSLIENKGYTFDYKLSKGYKKEDIFKLLNEADIKYKQINN